MKSASKEITLRGYVLRVVPYKESDAIITFLAEDQKVVFRARGVLKLTSKYYAACLLYTKSEVVLEEQNDFYYLVSAKALALENALYENLDAMMMLNLSSEAMLTFLNDEIDAENYRAFAALMKSLSQEDFIYTLTLINIVLVIKKCGLALDVNECVVCSRKDKIVNIDYLQGGFVCFKHSKEIAEPNYLKTLRYLFMVDENNYFHHQIDKPLAIRLIKELMNYLKNQFDYKELNFLKLFNEIYR